MGESSRIGKFEPGRRTIGENQIWWAMGKEWLGSLEFCVAQADGLVETDTWLGCARTESRV